ncbi:DUF4269 domain-containing protein [Paenibacillus sp. PR3]|uniref:DUF4269 domain-containing protein n=1 Tax=Paenibacillus terricola TaxID=2763503 RepID=A0ABR8N1X0_9BACL|nr:DUF4269 domain-containing protein [Paenibacillus terricola]MBD3922182.1 DUF4269 domain-containing protein [Paenibacillus terricola]
MELLIALFLWALGLFIFFFILYYVVKGAINNSRVASNLDEMNRLLKIIAQDKMQNLPLRARDQEEEWEEVVKWMNTDYLKVGSIEQDDVYHLLTNHRVLYILQDYNPILVGTVPIAIHVPSSDLDIICSVQNFSEFERLLQKRFQQYSGFKMTRSVVDGMGRVKANFTINEWPIEIFGQNKPTFEQNGFVHMVVEDRLLKLFGEPLRQAVIARKLEGMKTEPAFADILQLEGDPYTAMLELSEWTDEKLSAVFADQLKL